jgi:tRNA (5-methylaminomethyl-2-thiouridylate)-methyltransferase
MEDHTIDVETFPVAAEFQGASIAEIQQRLVQKGIAYQQATDTSSGSFTQVPGCIATVFLQTLVTVTDDNPNTVVQIQGTADALVSRGLLAVLSESIEALSALPNGSTNSVVERILQIDPTQIATQLGVAPALSPGRNDGVANMMRLVQQQVQLQLQLQLQLQKDGASSHEEEEEEKASILTLSTSTDTDEHQHDHDHQKKKPTVALLLSGGVDSSVALHLLMQQGYDVTPFYLKIWLEDELSHLGECPWEDDLQWCRQVCEHAGNSITLHTMSLQSQYQQHVMDHTLQEAKAGRTPNPDILCNSRIKFGCFLEELAGSFDHVASGHYAQLQLENEDEDGNNTKPRQKLYRAPDPIKDQSYFLCALSQAQLQTLLFPIGHLEKSEVRQLADQFQLPNRHRPDSQGLCFLGKLKFSDFLQAQLGEQPGDIIDAVSGLAIGQHKGVWYHTVGQRKGIGKSLFPLATSQGPWYVVAKDPSQNIVYASNQYDEQVFAQARSQVHVEDIHWIAGSPPTIRTSSEEDGRLQMPLQMKIRHGPRLVHGTLELLLSPDEDPNQGIVRLEQKDGGLAPGQFIVFYKEDGECLGGGIISERHWATFLRQAKSLAPQEGIVSA